MIRVVIDTNILVSALIQPGSLPAAVLLIVLSGRIQLCVSEDVFSEYDEVIRRPRFKHSAEVIESTLQEIRKLGRWVKPEVHIEECTDLADNVFLECAEAAGADYLITGNRRHFPDQWKKTKVISAREFIELLIDEEKA